MNSRVIKGKSTTMTQPFHYANTWSHGEYYNYYHSGVDLTGFNGTCNLLDWIVAHSAGTVMDVRTDCQGFEEGSYGNYVLLKHSNGYFTMYAHLAYGYVNVKVGQKVKKGEVLGYMDNTGTSFGGHLHWEVRTPNGECIDPEPYLNKNLPGSTPSKKGKLKLVDGVWCYVVDGKVDTSYNGIAKNKNGWWKCTKGKVDFTYNGLANNENGWFMIQSGKVDFDYNGLCENKNGVWVLEKGKVNFGFNGKYKFSGSTFNVKNGKVVRK